MIESDKDDRRMKTFPPSHQTQWHMHTSLTNASWGPESEEGDGT